ncbi:carboxylesterase family protein [Streptomyces broussonetiae]|uniref:Carboxylesterase family protein n=1 Tax=Streptomyces broussonetiae TaxID=2686304 RepID=A0A6I6NDE2_9ACTN|nr:carboxylesterase family protein [Streptomyces broussonetiae]
METGRSSQDERGEHDDRGREPARGHGPRQGQAVTQGGAVTFRGIPYAASPAGEPRFAAPRQHPGWTGVREAVQGGPAAPQATSRLEQVMGHRAG